MEKHGRRTDGPDYVRGHERSTDRESRNRLDVPIRDGEATTEARRDTDVPAMDTEQPPRDPWAHRSAAMRCSTCMFFVEKPGFGTRVLGRCRRRCPTMNGYPAVYTTDWCGDHKLDETK